MSEQKRFIFSKQLFVVNLRVFFAISCSSVVTGLASALFLWLLDLVTRFRFHYQWIIFLLPLAGILIVWLYKKANRYGRYADEGMAGKHFQLTRGNDLIIDEIHVSNGLVPVRLTPLIMITTLLTHLFGGSAGREGTALQMGGGMAAACNRLFALNPAQRSIVFTTALAAGFGAVFGTPWAGAVFAIEVLTRKKPALNAIIPCVFAAFTGDYVCRLTGVHHTIYEVAFRPFFAGEIDKTGYRGLAGDLVLLAKVAGAGVLFGLAARLFIQFFDQLKALLVKYLPNTWLQPMLGGSLVLLITYLLGTTDYLGLGVVNPGTGSVSILSSFNIGGADSFSWLWKLILTVITLGFGFRGGEVTPLFFIGATLGNVLASASGAPVDLFAAAGFIAVFAGATKTPVACTIMGMELFGGSNLLFYAVACTMAVLVSGSAGIYKSQRIN